MKPTWMEQYKLLFAAFNDEISRFWSRFNILVGIQMGGFIGVLASVRILVANPGLFRLSLALMTLYSFATAVITVRGHLMHEALLQALAMMEADSGGEIQLLGLARRSSRVPFGLNQIVGICIASIFFICWLSFLIMAEVINYGFAVPK